MHSSTLNCLQFNFFLQLEAQKIASHFKKMQILVFPHAVALHQTILETTRDLHLQNSPGETVLFAVTDT